MTGEVLLLRLQSVELLNEFQIRISKMKDEFHIERCFENNIIVKLDFV